MMQNIISTPLKFKSRLNFTTIQSYIKTIQLTLPQNLRELTLHITSAFGLLAIAILVLMFINPSLTNQFKQLSPFGKENVVSDIEVDPSVEVPSLSLLMATPQLIASSNDADSTINAIDNAKFIGTATQQKLVTNWLARRYRVANDAINMLVSASYLSAKETQLDPLLILSVIAIESRFNPFSESPVGAQGLMQVMSKVHHDKFSEHGGVKAALNPVANIQVGAAILQDYVKRSGSVEGGLKRYVGAADMDTDGGYGALVLAEYKRLKEVAAGKRVSIYATTQTKPTEQVQIEKAPASASNVTQLSNVPNSAVQNTVNASNNKNQPLTIANPISLATPKIAADISM